MNLDDLKKFEDFKNNTNLIFVVDHAGRAGNGFFQTIFDLHPEVIVCPWIHYLYSYIIEEFGDKNIIKSIDAWNFIKNSHYFACVYHDLEVEHTSFFRTSSKTFSSREFITKMGGDANVDLNRSLLRKLFDSILLSSDNISRHDLLCAIYYSYAISAKREIRDIKYIMTADSISTRKEFALNGFSAEIIDTVVLDFPSVKIIHLERDPRAGIASTNHQFINSLGNMYGLHFGNFWKRLIRLIRMDFDWDCVFVFGFWLLYYRQTYESIMKKREVYKDLFITVRNEDLNLDFNNTMKKLSAKIEISMLKTWTDKFQPTMLGSLWKGTGAYNSNYQENKFGPLENDSDDLAKKAIGPNAHVTKRWKSKLSKTEIFIIESLLAPELKFFDYDFMYWNDNFSNNKRLKRLLWFPLSGELPKLTWVLKSRHFGIKEFFNRIFYIFFFPIFYIFSRIIFLRIIKKNIFY